MITGDYPATARAIAGQAGLDATDVVTGGELEALSDAELAGRVQTATVFARIMPEQKLRIVNAFKTNGDIVAMTGDGVNDAPSLKAAHIGIAMGGRGTDVAREASSIVLLDDDFGSIVTAIRLGRRIYDNLRKAMGFIFAVHVPIAGLALLPLLVGLPILFGPMHIAFLEMVIDPVCSLVFEAETEEDDVMRRPSRAPNAPAVLGSLDRLEPLAGNLCAGSRIGDLPGGLQARNAGSRSARTHILFVGTGHRWPDLRQPILQCVAGHGATAAESRTGVGLGYSHHDVGPHLAVAARERPLSLRAPSRGRSVVDHWRRHHRACGA